MLEPLILTRGPMDGYKVKTDKHTFNNCQWRCESRGGISWHCVYRYSPKPKKQANFTAGRTVR